MLIDRDNPWLASDEESDSNGSSVVLFLCKKHVLCNLRKLSDRSQAGNQVTSTSTTLDRLVEAYCTIRIKDVCIGVDLIPVFEIVGALVDVVLPGVVAVAWMVSPPEHIRAIKIRISILLVVAHHGWHIIRSFLESINSS